MLNRISIIGRVGKDPEFKTSQGGTPFCRFSVATSEKWKDKQTGEQNEETEWHRCLLFQRLAETARDYVYKGQLIYIEGKMHYDSYENKDGHKVYTAEIRVSEMKFLSYKDRDAQGERPENAPNQAGQPASNDSFGDGDLPF